MKRRLFNIVAAISAVVFLLAAGLRLWTVSGAEEISCYTWDASELEGHE